MYYVYALQSLRDKNWIYIGYSDDLRKRFESHCAGKVRSTKPKRPLQLVYYEAYKSKDDARKREYHLKTGQQRELLKMRIVQSLNQT